MEEPREFVADGYNCLIKQGPFSLLGYVEIPEGHPWYRKSYHELSRVKVHGGLTYSEPFKPGDWDAKGDSWWIGFDCAHVGDTEWLGGHAKGEDYVEGEVRRLARQAAELFA